jgi:hypothetical protein
MKQRYTLCTMRVCVRVFVRPCDAEGNDDWYGQTAAHIPSSAHPHLYIFSSLLQLSSKKVRFEQRITIRYVVIDFVSYRSIGRSGGRSKERKKKERGNDISLVVQIDCGSPVSKTGQDRAFFVIINAFRTTTARPDTEMTTIRHLA